MNKRLLTAGTVCLVSAGLCLSGCDAAREKQMTQPYAFEERTAIWTENQLDTGFAELFAEDLSVVMDESAYAANDVTSEAAVLLDVSNRTALYSKHAFERLSPASTTKIMTALLVVKYGNLEDQVTVTEDVVITESGATLCNIKPGDRLSMEQLLYGLMLPSGNDAGAAIAVHMGGSIEGFSEMMNEEAKRLGATGTHFVNPHGLTDDQHYTTAYDLYLIFQEALKYPEFRKVTAAVDYTASYVDKDGNPVSQTWNGSNWYMIGKRDTPDGLTVFSGKTGTTRAAGYCLVMASSDEEGQEYISIVLKADSRPGLYDNMTNIIRKIVD